MQLGAEELVLVVVNPLPLFEDVADDEEEDVDAAAAVDDVDDDDDDDDDDEDDVDDDVDDDEADDDDGEFVEEDDDDVDGPLMLLLLFVLNALFEELVELDDELEPPVAAATLGPPLPDGAAPTVGKFWSSGSRTLSDALEGKAIRFAPFRRDRLTYTAAIGIFLKSLHNDCRSFCGCL